MAVYAYMRVSTNTEKNGRTQTTDNQKLEIEKSGYAVTEFFSEEGVSGKMKQMNRPQFKRMFDKAVPGDTCIVVKLDRLGRTALDVLEVMKEFSRKEVKLIVLQLGSMDMTSSAGKMMITMLAAVAELERDMIVERVNSGIARSREEGTKFGRSLTIAPDVLTEAVILKKGGSTYDTIAEKLALPRASLARNVARWGDNLEEYKKEWEARQEQYSITE